MTPDERDLLQRFLQDLTATRPQGKDAEAAGLIDQALRSSPDAAYVLVQHAILSDQALHAAQDQIAQLQAQLRSAPAQAPASFLGQAGGQGAQSPPQPSPWARAANAAAPPAQDQYPPQRQGFFGPGPFQQGGGLGSFLRNAGTTAAGVAGGALLFDGLSGLFGGHRGFGGLGGFGGGGWGGQPTEIVENNYYDDPGGASGDFGGGGGGDLGGGDFGGGDGGSFDT